jgi:hypothetical protein
MEDLQRVLQFALIVVVLAGGFFVLTRAGRVKEGPDGLTSTPDRFEVSVPGGGFFFSSVHIVFDRALGKVLSGKRAICNLGAVVEVEAVFLGERSEVRLVYVGSDGREERRTLIWAADWNEAEKQRDLINGWLQAFNH